MADRRPPIIWSSDALADLSDIWDYYANNAGRHTADKIVIDFAAVTTGKRLPLTHPGATLRDDFLVPMKISVYTLSQAIKVPRSRVNDTVLGRRGITADTAFHLARYFSTTPDFWINLQARHDLDAAERKLCRRIEREVRPRAA